MKITVKKMYYNLIFLNLKRIDILPLQVHDSFISDFPSQIPCPIAFRKMFLLELLICNSQSQSCSSRFPHMQSS